MQGAQKLRSEAHLQGALQRFTLLDTFQKVFLVRISGISSLNLRNRNSYLTGQGCRAILLRAGQMDFLRNHFLKTSQLAMRNLDLQTVQELAHLFVGDFILSGDFHSQGAGDFPVLGCFPNFHADFFFFHNTPSQNFRENIAQMPAGKNKKVKQIP